MHSPDTKRKDVSIHRTTQQTLRPRDRDKAAVRKVAGLSTPTCDIVHMVRQKVKQKSGPAVYRSSKDSRDLMQSGRLVYEKARTKLNFTHHTPLFTYHTPTIAAHEGKITPYTSVLGVPEYAIPPSASPVRKRPRLPDSRTCRDDPVLPGSPAALEAWAARGVLPVSIPTHNASLSALEQRRRHNVSMRAFNRHLHRAQLISALRNMTYDAEFDVHEYLRDDIARELRMHSLTVLRHKYSGQGEINFIEHEVFKHPEIHFKDRAAIEKKQLHSISSVQHSFIDQYDNTDYKCRWKEDDTKMYNTGDTHAQQLKRRKQLLINMRVDQYCEDDVEAEYVAMYGVFNKYRGLDFKRSAKIPQFVNGIYNDLIDLVYMRPALECNADSSFDARDDTPEPDEEESQNLSQQCMLNLASISVSETVPRTSQSTGFRRPGSNKSHSISGDTMSQDSTSTTSGKWFGKGTGVHHVNYPFALPNILMKPAPQGIQARESSPNVPKMGQFVYQQPPTFSGNQHFTSFTLTNETDAHNDGTGSDIFTYITNAFKQNALIESIAEERSSVWEISENAINITISSND